MNTQWLKAINLEIQENSGPETFLKREAYLQKDSQLKTLQKTKTFWSHWISSCRKTIYRHKNIVFTGEPPQTLEDNKHHQNTIKTEKETKKNI